MTQAVELQAGRELDAQVAERLGCEVAWYAVFAETIHPTCKCKDRRHNLDHPAIAGEIKPYSTSIEVAWDLVGAMEVAETSAQRKFESHFVSIFDVTPFNICLAFLKATEGKG